jgi:hypothetical protein
MSDFLILLISATLNCLFVYLATEYLFRVLGNSTKRSEIKESAVRFTRAILLLCIWAGSATYFTLGAVTLMDLQSPSQVPPEYGWRNAIGIVNGVLPIVLVMLFVRQAEKREKQKLASLRQ